MTHPRFLVIDNYDSFTYNLVQFFGRSGVEVKVVRNDEGDLASLLNENWRGIILSPGPCTPYESNNTLRLLQHVFESGSTPCPILGVCLGHQALGVAAGGKISGSAKLRHGKIAFVQNDGMSLFANCPSPAQMICYHSLVVTDLPESSSVRITACDEVGEIMGLQHKSLPIYGIQFHPESVLSANGETVLENFLSVCLSS